MKCRLPNNISQNEQQEIEWDKLIEDANKEISELTLKDTVFEEGIRELRFTNRSKLKEIADIKESLSKFREMKERQIEEIEKIKSSLSRRNTVQE